jgi:hypothetical protein
VGYIIIVGDNIDIKFSINLVFSLLIIGRAPVREILLIIFHIGNIDAGLVYIMRLLRVTQERMDVYRVYV